jgi:hypothetical protein
MTGRQRVRAVVNRPDAVVERRPLHAYLLVRRVANRPRITLLAS